MIQRVAIDRKPLTEFKESVDSGDLKIDQRFS